MRSLIPNPQAFGISEAQAAAYGQIEAALQSAVRAAITPQTRTLISVAEKNRLMKAMQRGAPMNTDEEFETWRHGEHGADQSVLSFFVFSVSPC